MEKTHWILVLAASLLTFFVGVCGGATVGGIGVFAGPKVVELLTAENPEGIEIIDDDGDGVDDTVPGDPRCREDVPHCMKVREARAKIAPLNKDILEYATKAYNKGVPSHVPWAKRCVQKAPEFERVHRKTVFNLAQILGTASHESMGCQMIKARNGDGGTGYMQVTSAPPVFKTRAAKMLGLDVSELNMSDPVHNAAVGMIIWDDCERQTGRRDLAALCYNRGIFPVNRAAWCMKNGITIEKCGEKHGRKLRDLGSYPSFSLLQPYNRGMVYKTLGPISRKYTGEVIAHMVMVKQIMAGKTPKDLPAGKLLRLEDIPGWNPKHDGDEFVEALIAEE